MKKRVYTYGQLDTILHRRGEWGHELDPYLGKPNPNWLYARLYGNLFVTALNNHSVLRIKLLSKNEPRSYVLANVALMAGGDTLYEVLPTQRHAMSKAHTKRLSAAGRRKWLAMARAFTPYDESKTLPFKKLYRVRPGGSASEVASTPNVSVLAPRSTLPTPQEWVEDAAMLTYPKFCARAKRFAARLIRELPECGFPAEAQRIWYGGQRQSGLYMRVGTQPREREASKTLTVAITMHDEQSRRHFRIDPEYGKRHCHVIAWEGDEHERPLIHKCLQWQSTRSALTGIKEWLIPNIYIPGL